MQPKNRYHCRDQVRNHMHHAFACRGWLDNRPRQNKHGRCPRHCLHRLGMCPCPRKHCRCPHHFLHWLGMCPCPRKHCRCPRHFLHCPDKGPHMQPKNRYHCRDQVRNHMHHAFACRGWLDNRPRQHKHGRCPRHCLHRLGMCPCPRKHCRCPHHFLHWLGICPCPRKHCRCPHHFLHCPDKGPHMQPKNRYHCRDQVRNHIDQSVACWGLMDNHPRQHKHCRCPRH